jgi:hypothetical protein
MMNNKTMEIVAKPIPVYTRLKISVIENGPGEFFFAGAGSGKRRGKFFRVDGPVGLSI